MGITGTWKRWRDRLTLQFVAPPWRLPLFLLMGVLLGLALLTGRLSNAVSYLSSDPATCINCHIMVPEYAAWNHSSHRQAATCNDCHVPNSNPVAQYFFKARDGNRHAFMFTLRLEPQAIRLSKGAVPVVQSNCIRCHQRTVEQVHVVSSRVRPCWDCHRETPHGLARSLSATPQARRPGLPPAGFNLKP